MASARKKALTLLKNWVMDSSSRMKKLASGTGDSGARAAPARTKKNDQNLGSRIDYGPMWKDDKTEYRRYNWQLNSDANDSSIKKLAQKDSHKVWSHANVPVTPAPTEEEARKAVESMFKELEENLEDE